MRSPVAKQIMLDLRLKMMATPTADHRGAISAAKAKATYFESREILRHLGEIGVKGSVWMRQDRDVWTTRGWVAGWDARPAEVMSACPCLRSDAAKVPPGDGVIRHRTLPHSGGPSRMSPAEVDHRQIHISTGTNWT